MKITSIKQQVKRRNRYSVFVDDSYAFSLSEDGLLSSGLASGQEIDAERYKELKKAAGMDKAYGNALRYAALRPRSEWEMQDYYRRKEIDEEAAERISDRLRRVGLVDDKAFALAWISNRRLRPVSARRLQLELKQKHVPQAVIDDVLCETAPDEREELRKLIAKKRVRYPDRQKLMQYLVRQGFGYDDIKSVLSED